MQSVAQGYPGSLENYLDDMDTRELLNEAWQTAREDQREESAERLAVIDRQMRGLVIPTRQCLYGDLVAEDEGWTPDAQWWYFSRPESAGPRLMSELGDDAEPEGGP